MRPAIFELPRQPDLSGGLCASHPSPDWWSSTRMSERKAAIAVCQRCPLLRVCAEWSLSLPLSDRSVWGGMWAAERFETRRQSKAGAARERAREAARLDRQREVRRRSERLRRMLGKAPGPEQRRAAYAADPEPQKARSRAWYAAHRDEILARRRTMAA